jgi:formylglycine-generating enzyme required for sulfatase activity
MGSRPGDAGRQEDEDDRPGPGGRQVEVAFVRPFAVGQLEVTRGEFAAFVRETGHKADEGCHARYGGWQLYPDLSWKDPGFAQDDKHPAVCVSWRDAKAYASWLSRKTGHEYRLLSEAEWEYAARGNASGLAVGRFHFGSDEKALCQYGNAADMTALQANPEWLVSQCIDGHVNTAPAGSYKPNAFGIFDTLGNVWEWVEDCYAESHQGVAEAVAKGIEPPAHVLCAADAPRVLKGGSWSDSPKLLRPSARVASPPDIRDEIAGFRIARALAP